MISKELLLSYKSTCYEIINPNIEIFIDQENKKLDGFLHTNNFKSWCFITAWNPYSKSLTTIENIKLNILLETDLKEHKIYAAKGKDTHGVWPVEPSYFIVNISKEAAVSLGKKYQQNAIVFGEINSLATLLVLV